MIFCLMNAPDTSSTIRTQTELPFRRAAMKIVRTPRVAMAKLAPMSVRVGVPLGSFAATCHRVCVPRWKSMPMQFTKEASVSVLARAVVDPESPRRPEPLASSVGSEIRLSQVQPRRPAAP